MNTELYRLVYLSQNNIAGDGDALHKEISQILRAARENNLKNEITGALMFNSEYFAQVLEGPHHQVESLFDRIQCDERHSGMTMLGFTAIESRSFPEWAMAYIGEESNLSDRFFMIAEETNFDLDNVSGDIVVETLLARLQQSTETSGEHKAA